VQGSTLIVGCSRVFWMAGGWWSWFGHDHKLRNVANKLSQRHLEAEKYKPFEVTGNRFTGNSGLCLILAYCGGQGWYVRSTLMGTLPLVPAAVTQPHAGVRETVRGKSHVTHGWTERPISTVIFVPEIASSFLFWRGVTPQCSGDPTVARILLFKHDNELSFGGGLDS